MMPLSTALRLRDPYVLTDVASGWYYLFGTTDPDCWGPKGGGFEAYRSRDLETWEGPFTAFCPGPGFWATHQFWAPEVHLFGGRYYMFASFKHARRARGTQVLVADAPLGPYQPLGGGPVTPEGWDCLDGTLFCDDEGVPWLVFCQEWTQIRDGAMLVMPLRRDLSGASGPARTLFHASEAPWTVPIAEHPGCWITDGPWLHRHASGALLLLWSSLGPDGYAVGVARSPRGSLFGPWQHETAPLFPRDGGHAMTFCDFSGNLRLTLHQPNRHGEERPRFFHLTETANGLALNDA